MSIPEYKWEKVALDDPNRCQMPTRSGYCYNKAVEGSQYCLAHGGYQGAKRIEKANMKNYKLAKFHERADELSESESITSLRDEVGLLRMLIEEKINRCTDKNDLLLISGPLSDLIMKSEKLVTAMYRLEEKMGQHIDKTKLVNLAQIMIEIINKYITNPEVLDAIGEDFYNALAEA